MNTEPKLSGFAKYAWFTLAYNIVVILWGVFLRASKSGDGCGQHWLTCGGEVIPSAPELKTIIEFSHRISSALAGIVVIILVILAFRVFQKGHLIRKMALASLIFIILEGLVGAGLVLTGNTAENWTPTRPLWMAAHLVNTFTLLAVLTLTGWFASGGRPLNFRVPRKYLVLIGAATAGILIVGMSGSLAALSNMLFPSGSIAEGVAKDFAEASPLIVRLRISHPILSISIGIFVLFATGWLKTQAPGNRSVARWSGVLSLLILAQFASGAVTILTLAPIVMQLIHLFLADAIWISFVLFCANFLSAERTEAEGIQADPGGPE